MLIIVKFILVQQAIIRLQDCYKTLLQDLQTK